MAEATEVDIVEATVVELAHIPGATAVDMGTVVMEAMEVVAKDMEESGVDMEHMGV